MRRNKLWAGLDIGVETTRVCIIDNSGEVMRECSCHTDTKEVRHELARFRRDRFARVIIEAGVGSHLARGLRSLGYPVELFEARKLSKFLRVRRNKTDAGDAHGIAEAGRIGASVVSRVFLKDLETQCLQARLTIRRRLISQRVSATNLLGRQIEQFGGRYRATHEQGQLKRVVEAEIKRIFRGEPLSLTAELKYLLEHCERLREHQREIDRDLANYAADNEVCCRLMEIPGVGPICALNFYAAIGDPRRFERTGDVGNYFGLTPRLHQSGLLLRMGRISKMGNKSVRSLLVQSALTFMRCENDSDLRNWAANFEARSGKARARVALARKLAVVMLAIWKSGSRYDPNHNALRPDCLKQSSIPSPPLEAAEALS